MRRNLPRLLGWLLPEILIVSACGARAATPPTVQTLTVFAAASLNKAFTEMGANFEAAHPGVKISFNFAGSQTLSAQLLEGAPADVFASANQAEMDKLVSAGLVGADSPKDFVTNELIVILPPANSANLTSLQDLAKPGMKLVLADAGVPAGKYARQILANLSQDAAYGADFARRVLANVVSNETDVETVVAKVRLGEADAGIVYISDAAAEPALKTIEIPAQFNLIAKYPLASLTKSEHKDLAAAFTAYVLAPEGQAVLKKWGFSPVSP